MRSRPTIFFFSAGNAPVPALVGDWAAREGFPVQTFSDAGELESIVLRGHPGVLFLDGETGGDAPLQLLRRLKSDAFTAIIPSGILLGSSDPETIVRWFEAGADEVFSGVLSDAERRARIAGMHKRAERDVSVHPSTRLPGAPDIERAILAHMQSGEEFAVCYADLDHFKEFNDRYSYYDGDRVIFILSRILHDVVKGMLGPRGFVGHIGGDDFIYIIPASEIAPVCSEALSVFDTLIPLQYNEQDRRAGYFFGKDRRGQLHRVPMMTLSIGVVTNRNRRFAHPAELSELATEMKSYAKTLPGSVFVVDRRRSIDPEEPAPTPVEPGAPSKDAR